GAEGRGLTRPVGPEGRAAWMTHEGTALGPRRGGPDEDRDEGGEGEGDPSRNVRACFGFGFHDRCPPRCLLLISRRSGAVRGDAGPGGPGPSSLASSTIARRPTIPGGARRQSIRYRLRPSVPWTMGWAFASLASLLD